MKRKKILLTVDYGRKSLPPYKTWCRIFWDIYEESIYYYRENHLPAICLPTHYDYYCENRLFATWKAEEDRPHFYDKTLQHLPLIKGFI